jgi:hypothetical protein
MEKNFHDIFFLMNMRILYHTNNRKRSLNNHVAVSTSDTHQSLFSKKYFFFNIDYIREIDEVRSGFHTSTFDGLLKKHIVASNDVSYSFSLIVYIFVLEK